MERAKVVLGLAVAVDPVAAQSTAVKPSGAKAAAGWQALFADYAGYFDNFAADLIEPPPTDFDVLILNGDVYPDGDSGPLAVDIGIIDDRIASMESDLSGFTAREVIDATGLLVVPGFIDAHSHFLGAGRALDALSLHSPPVGDVTNIDELVEKAWRCLDLTAGWVQQQG